MESPTMGPKHVSDTWERGSPYEQYVGRWSRAVAPLFLSWRGIPPGRRWLDPGCGTGALCAAILDRCSPARGLSSPMGCPNMPGTRNHLRH